MLRLLAIKHKWNCMTISKEWLALFNSHPNEFVRCERNKDLLRHNSVYAGVERDLATVFWDIRNINDLYYTNFHSKGNRVRIIKVP